MIQLPVLVFLQQILGQWSSVWPRFHFKPGAMYRHVSPACFLADSRDVCSVHCHRRRVVGVQRFGHKFVRGGSITRLNYPPL